MKIFAAIERQLGRKIQGDRMSHVTQIPDSDERQQSNHWHLSRATPQNGMIRVITSKPRLLLLFISASTFDIVMHAYSTHNGTMHNWEVAPNCGARVTFWRRSRNSKRRRRLWRWRRRGQSVQNPRMLSVSQRPPVRLRDFVPPASSKRQTKAKVSLITKSHLISHLILQRRGGPSFFFSLLEKFIEW